MAVALGREVRWRLVLLGLTLAFGLCAVLSTARVSEARPGAQSVPIEHAGAAARVVLVFIDSLSRDVATDAQIMPVLGRLAREGASFDVEPCRDQLTYLCIRAALTGHDDSSLLALADNFRPGQEGPPETLLSALAAKGRRVSVIGTSDFHPYRRALFVERPLSKQQETPEHVVGLLAATRNDDAQLVIVSLGSGDMTAHAHGVNSPEYRAAFRRLDDTVGAIAAAIDPDTTLVVFGDHGHDELGRHLPGTEARTWAAYHGKGFRPGFQSPLHVTDHRALLGVLLGVATEPTYRGPEPSSVFQPAWVDSVLRGRLPKLTSAPAHGADAAAVRWLAALGMGTAFVVAAWLLGRSQRALPLVWLSLAATFVALAIGVGYDRVRGLVHDHGDSPERGLSLLVPLLVGGAVAWLIRRARVSLTAGSGWLPTAAACALLVTFLLLLPTAYYYGSRRATGLAAILGIVVMLKEYWRRSTQPAHALVLPTLSLVFAIGVLVTLYQVRQLGPETAGAATWALDASIYVRWAWLPLIAAKLALFGFSMAAGAARKPLDAAGAAALLALCVMVELGGVALPRAAYGALFGALVLGSMLARRVAPSSLVAAGLLLLDHLYGRQAARIAPLEMILAAAAAAQFAWQRMAPSAVAKSWLTALTLVVGAYLTFWPSVGFHLAGLDFGYMFQWVPAEKYERLWLLIALGVVVKLALPLLLLIGVMRQHLRDRLSVTVVSVAWTAKVALLSMMIAAYAVQHTMASQQALAMLAELLLLMFGACVAMLGLPTAQRVVESSPALAPELRHVS